MVSLNLTQGGRFSDSEQSWSEIQKYFWFQFSLSGWITNANMSVTVAEEGNRRVGEMSIDETEQCVLGNVAE